MKKLSVLLVVVLLVTLVATVSAAPRPPMTAKGESAQAPVRLSLPAAPGSLWANGSWDDINGLASELNTAVPDARTADDFELGTGCPVYDITQIRGTHMTSSNPYNAQLEVYADSGGNGPGALIGTYPMATATYLGQSQFGWAMVEYAYNTPGLQLAPGHYWVSSIGLGDGTFGDRSFFATASNGVVQLQEGYFLSSSFGFTTWTPGTAVYGYTTDYAFDVDGACAQQNVAVHIDKMKMNAAPAAKPGLWKIVTALRVKDAAGGFPGGVTVLGDYTYPDGSTVSMSYVTTALGQAKFPIKTSLLGTYQFCVTNMTGTGFVYDPLANTDGPCKVKTIP